MTFKALSVYPSEILSIGLTDFASQVWQALYMEYLI